MRGIPLSADRATFEAFEQRVEDAAFARHEADEAWAEREFESRFEPAPSLSDSHAQWHAVNGRWAVCPLDCGAGETFEGFEPATGGTIRCAHCSDRHPTVADVRLCSGN